MGSYRAGDDGHRGRLATRQSRTPRGSQTTQTRLLWVSACCNNRRHARLSGGWVTRKIPCGMMARDFQQATSGRSIWTLSPFVTRRNRFGGCSPLEGLQVGLLFSGSRTFANNQQRHRRQETDRQKEISTPSTHGGGL